MSLTMSLNRVDRTMLPYINRKLYEIKREDPELYQQIKPHLRVQPLLPGIKTLFEVLGYWESVPVHEWFLRKLQVDNYYNDHYEIGQEWLQELYALCLEVLQKAELEKGDMVVGYTFVSSEGNNRIDTVPGHIITNPEVVRGVLPCQEETWYGVTVYDGNYMAGIAQTVGIIGKALYTTDYDAQAICYHWG